MFSSRHIGISINCSPMDIYTFASNPENLPKWAAGLSSSTIVKSGDIWVCESPMGLVKIKFTEKNVYGVMDHDVTLPSGEVNHNPFRVISNGAGSEVVFTLYKLPRMNDEQFEHDASLIKNDLETLKKILEK